MAVGGGEDVGWVSLGGGGREGKESGGAKSARGAKVNMLVTATSPAP